MHHRPQLAASGIFRACWVACVLAAFCASSLAQAAGTKKTATPTKLSGKSVDGKEVDGKEDEDKPEPELVLFIVVDASKGRARFKAVPAIVPAISRIQGGLSPEAKRKYRPIVGRQALVPSTGMIDAQVCNQIKQIKWTKERRKKGVRSVILTCEAEIEDARGKRADEDDPPRFEINLKVDCEAFWLKKDRREGYKKKKIWKKSFEVEYKTPKEQDPKKPPETEYSAMANAAMMFAEEFLAKKSRRRWQKK